MTRVCRCRVPWASITPSPTAGWSVPLFRSVIRPRVLIWRQLSAKRVCGKRFRRRRQWTDLGGCRRHLWRPALRYRSHRADRSYDAIDSSTTGGTNASFAAEAGYNFFAGSLTQGPVAGILLQRVYVNGFTEADAFAAVGGFTALSFADQMRNSAVTELGYQMSLSFGAWQPFAKIVWNHELASLDRSVTASLTTIDAPSYSLPAVVFGTDWATATVGTTVTVHSGVTAYAAFTTEVAQNNVVDYGGQLVERRLELACQGKLNCAAGVRQRFVSVTFLRSGLKRSPKSQAAPGSSAQQRRRAICRSRPRPTAPPRSTVRSGPGRSNSRNRARRPPP